MEQITNSQQTLDTNYMSQLLNIGQQLTNPNQTEQLQKKVLIEEIDKNDLSDQEDIIQIDTSTYKQQMGQTVFNIQFSDKNFQLSLNQEINQLQNPEENDSQLVTFNKPNPFKYATAFSDFSLFNFQEFIDPVELIQSIYKISMQQLLAEQNLCSKAFVVSFKFSEIDDLNPKQEIVEIPGLEQEANNIQQIEVIKPQNKAIDLIHKKPITLLHELVTDKKKVYQVKLGRDLLQSNAFKIIYSFLQQREKLHNTLINRRVCFEHAPYFVKKLMINSYFHRVEDSMRKFYSRNIEYNVLEMKVVFEKNDFKSQLKQFLIACPIIGKTVKTLHLYFNKKTSPTKENNVQIAQAFKNFTNLDTLILDQYVQDSMIEAILNECPENFKSVKKLLVNMETLKKATAEKFFKCFVNLEHLEIGKPNLNAYIHLINFGIKVQVLKIILPVKQLIDHMYRYIQFTSDTLIELEICRVATQSDIDLFKNGDRDNLNLSSLRRLRFTGLYDIAVKDFMREEYMQYLHEFHFSDTNSKTSRYYDSYIKQLGNFGLTDFYHQMFNDFDYFDRNVGGIARVIRENSKTMKNITIRFVLHDKIKENILVLNQFIDAIDTSCSQVERLIIDIDNNFQEIILKNNKLLSKLQKVGKAQGNFMKLIITNKQPVIHGQNQYNKKDLQKLQHKYSKINIKIVIKENISNSDTDYAFYRPVK